MAIILKITLGDDTRRISLDRAPSYDELAQLIRQLFGMSGAFVLKYQDEDKDWITVTSQAELSEAFNIVSAHFNNVLRVVVTVNDSKKAIPSSACPIDFLKDIIPQLSVGNMENIAEKFQSITLNGHPFDGKLLTQLLSNPAIQNILSQLGLSAYISSTPPPAPATNANGEVPIHFGITCDGCEAHPIMGTRFKCTICDDYDLCGVCQSKGDVHPSSHPMRQIDNPLPNNHHGSRGGVCTRRRWGARPQQCQPSQPEAPPATTTTETTPQVTNPEDYITLLKKRREALRERAQKLETERIQKEKDLEVKRAEVEKIEKEKADRIEKEKAEADRIESARAEQERLEAETKDREEKLRQERERLIQEEIARIEQRKTQEEEERKKRAEEAAKLQQPTLAETQAIAQLRDMGFSGDLLSALRRNNGDVEAAVNQLLSQL
eukprot:TRINITY_DN364_c0_g1_i2.p1 TRINITY_DN364_c0_g1~~TRINITY_DN364_c0_g1_i2.p1  ORF type:complete len:436 (-),score=129.59 TRINITY_DN364_c0_g1_i2:131-1438(-)